MFKQNELNNDKLVVWRLFENCEIQFHLNRTKRERESWYRINAVINNSCFSLCIVFVATIQHAKKSCVNTYERSYTHTYTLMAYCPCHAINCVNRETQRSAIAFCTVINAFKTILGELALFADKFGNCHANNNGAFIA